jgi:hypothetical protein
MYKKYCFLQQSLKLTEGYENKIRLDNGCHNLINVPFKKWPRANSVLAFFLRQDPDQSLGGVNKQFGHFLSTFEPPYPEQGDEVYGSLMG